MKFLTVYKKGTRYAVKMKLDNGTDIWANTTSAVYNFAKDKFEDGEEADFAYTIDNDKYNVTKITKKNGATAPNHGAPPSGPTCEECGKELKDDKYKKCYTCNQKNPGKKTGSGGGTYTKSSDTKKSIENQAMMKASAQAVATVMQGRVEDVGTLGEMIVELYKKLIAKIRE